MSIFSVHPHGQDQDVKHVCTFIICFSWIILLYLLAMIRTVESIYSNSLSIDGSSFGRPSQEENKFLFVAIEITASTSGVYTLTAESNIDTYGYLYKASFNPQSPWANLIAENDDNGRDSNFELNTTLTTNQPIVLVVTTFSASETGSFKIVVRGPKQVTFKGCSIVSFYLNSIH